MTERIRYAAAAAFVILGFACFFALSAPWKQVAFVAAVAAGAAVLLTSEAGRRFVSYARDSVAEVKKVVWPTGKETVQTTLIVFAFVSCMAAFLWIVDQGLNLTLIELIKSWKS